MKNQSTSRRGFIKSSSAFASVSILPSSLIFGKNTPSNQFRFAKIGIGGMGYPDIQNTIAGGGKLVAMCDVDTVRAAKTIKEFKNVPLYEDYRVMLDKQGKDIDGVVISTPDHTHALIALEVMRRGKHVYLQKPLARTYEECKILQESAKKYGVVTQMGNQGHSSGGLEVYEEMLKQGAYGDISEVHSWSNRPVWPQGMTKVPKKEKTPKTMNWDLWLGPAAKRPFSKLYAPFKWRGWWDFGCGAMGDMAVHNIEPAFWIFKLGMPDSVITKATSGPTKIAYPEWSIIEMKYNKTPVTGKPMTLTWYDGNKLPDMPQGAHPEYELDGNGCMIIGSKMTTIGASHAKTPRPVAIQGKDYGSPVKDLERYWRTESKKFPGQSHYQQWVEASKAGDLDAPGSKFDYSAPFTQALLISCISLRFPGQELKWDHANNRFANNKAANEFLSFTPRKGFELEI